VKGGLARACGVVLLTLACAVSILLLALMLLEEKMIFVPSRGAVGASPGGEVWLRAADGVEVHGWYLTHPSATHTVLHLHGNAGNLENRRGILMQLRDQGCNVLAIDYRGYGRSGGQASEAGLNADTLAAYDWLTQHTEPARIIAYGESLGGGPASELATRHKLAGIVLQSTFTSIPDMAALTFPWLPVRAIVRTRFDVLAKLHEISAPKLLIHSRSDEMIPFAMAERLYASARAPKRHLWLEHSRHNDLFEVDGSQVLRALREFVAGL
jgi:uncharacterized protein